MSVRDDAVEFPFLTAGGEAWLARFGSGSGTFYWLDASAASGAPSDQLSVAGRMPHELLGGDGFLFLLQWDVDRPLDENFLLIWDVIRERIDGADFLLIWDVRKDLGGMTLLWQVIQQEILDGFDAELVSPAASATRTPDL